MIQSFKNRIDIELEIIEFSVILAYKLFLLTD
jgi:hypothetical protein